MSELNKTTCYFVAALAAVALAIFTRPSVEEFDVEQRLGETLVEDFPTDAPKRLRITHMNEETGELDSFEVAEKSGGWIIPSKGGYPADATRQLAEAVEGVVGREILEVVDADSAQHVTYGVVAPEDSSADAGFGTHVELVGENDQSLADLIIGEQVTDSEQQHWVRRSGQDVVYAAEIDLSKFSTNFADWIEKDLLKLNTFDISEVSINDYSVQVNPVLTNRGLQLQVVEDYRNKFDLVFDDDQNQWLPKKLETYNTETNSYDPLRLADNEVLNADSLRELKSALEDLVIVDVERKPDGLSGDLKAGEEFMSSDETKMSLAQRGFYPLSENGGVALYSSEGEIVITLNSGVEYVLRFGELQADSSAEGETAEDAAETEAEQTTDDTEGNAGLNRYLFVMARFNESAIEPPVLEDLPELPAADEAAKEPATEEPSDENAESTFDESAEEATDETTDAADSTEETTDQPTTEQIEAERARIDLNNKRAQDEYNEKIAAGKKQVEELNDRFGDWYYVIPNDVFKKVHLGREQVITTAQPEAGGQAPPANPASPNTMIPGLPGLESLMGGRGAAAPPAAAEESDELPAVEAPESTPDASSSPDATAPEAETSEAEAAEADKTEAEAAPADEQLAASESESTEPTDSESPAEESADAPSSN
ncbi:DUF4340 domain-containing protein [Aeoliella mucimassa]|uniref:DUF4340 domain-containing protein n=1 Tax=Aeoliella mucimassa TaxID=2527972 RepID=A0A518AI50_9BACT|nr:DUF4340 domain-containing protein [Aeoliella mucimassa]QDU54395.1 hypothetical protein Pan181_05760 [Aeoliella mucimassa]